MALRSAAFATLAGTLIAVAGAPLELSFPAFLAPAALLAALEPAPGRVVGAARALWIGLVAGTVVQAISMYWVVGLLMDFGHFPFVGALPVGALLWVGQSIAYLAGAGTAAALMRAGAPGWLVLPACLTVAASLAPALFPWRYGLCQLPFLPYAQVADLGGLPLLDWLVATVGCGLLDAVRHRRRAAALAAALAFAAPPAYGLGRLAEVRAAREAAPSLAVGVVQPNVSIRDKHDPRLFFAQLRAMRATTAELEAAGAELVVWPETAYRFPVHRSMARDRDGALGLREDGVDGPLLVGVLSTGGVPGTALATDELGRVVGRFLMGGGQRYNSTLALDEEGRVVGIADKVHLLAFGEYTPLWDVVPWLRALPRGLTPGEGPQVLSVAGCSVAVLNCYEDLLPGFVRAQALTEPSLLVNVTNNAWFGDTTAPLLHHMNARLRAIETRRDLVRAVNTGASGHTAATGEDLARTGTFVPASFVARTRLLSGRTVWTALGDWVTPILAGGLLALVIRRRHAA